MKVRFLSYIVFSLLVISELFVFSNKAKAQSIVFDGETTHLNTGTLTGYTNNLAVYGFKITGSNETMGTVNILDQKGNALQNIFTNGRLYRTTTKGYNASSPGTLIGTVTFGNGIITISNMNDPISGTPYYYYLVVDCIYIGGGVDFQPYIGYGQSPSGIISSGGTNYNNNNNGYENYYHIAGGTPPAVSVSNLTDGLTPNTGNLVAGQSTVVAFGFSVTTTSNKTINQFNINNSTSTSLSSYFSSATLYRCNTNNYSTATTRTPVGTAAIGTNYITVTATEAINNTTQYYFLVLNCVSSFTTVPASIQLNFTSGQSSSALIQDTGQSFNNFNAFGNTYNLNYANISITKLTGGLSPGTLTAAQTDVAVFGFDVAVSGSVSIAEININSNNGGTYFNNPRLYWTSTTTYSTGTRHLVATGTFSGNFAHFTGITTETITNDTRHYFLVVDNIAPNSSNPTTAFSLTSGQSLNAIVQTSPSPSSYNNFNITGNNYTIPSPTFFIDGLNNPANNITTAMSPGLTNVAVFGFKVRAFGQITINKFNFPFSPGDENLFFSGAKLVVSTDEVYSADDTSLGSVNTGGSSSADIGDQTALNLSMNNVTKNFFLVVNINAYNNSSSVASASYGFTTSQSPKAVILGSPYQEANPISNVPGAPLTFPSNSAYIWTGNGNNTDLTNSSNWSKYSGSPGSTSDVIIPGGCTYYPNITATTTIASLTFSGSAANITIASGQTLQINNGLTLAAGATPTITGGMVSLPSGSVSTIASTAVLKLGANTTISNSGTLTLKSDANGTAGIAAIPSSSSISGSINAERWITGGAASVYRGYRLLSSPVNISNSTTGNIDLGYLNNINNVNGVGALTGGPGGTAKGFSVTSTTPAIYLYREDVVPGSGTNGGKNKGVMAVYSNGTGSSLDVATGSTTLTTTNLQLPVGNGFIFYNIGSTAQPGNTASNSTPASYAITAKGYLNQGTITFKNWYTGASTLSFTSSLPSNKGFNMVGNPYASSLDLVSFYGDNSAAIQPSIYVLNDAGQAYISYNASNKTSSSPAASQYIASGQGMIVQAISASALTFKESQKAAAQQLTGSQLLMGLPANEPTISGFYMKMEKDSLTNDYCGIYFDGSSDNFDSDDAIDLDGNSPKVYMSSYTADGQRTGINSLSDYKNGKAVKLYVNATTDGLYKLKIEQIKNIDAAYDIWLKDNYKGDSLDLRTNDTYSFNIIRSDAASVGADRFQVVIERKPLPAYQFVSLTGRSTSSGINITWKTQNEYDFTGFTVEKLDANKQYNPIYGVQSDGSGTYSFLDANPVPGINTYRIKQSDIDNKISYSTSVSVDPDADAQNNNLVVYPSSATSLLNIKFTNPLATPTNVVIVSVTGDVVNKQLFTQQQGIIDVSKLKTGVYFIQATDANTQQKIGLKRFIKL